MATSVKNSSVSGIYEVTITAAPVTVESVTVSVEGGGNAQIAVDGTLTLNAEVAYSSNATGEEAPTIEWTLTDSEDKAVEETVATITPTEGNTAEATLRAGSDLGSLTGFKVTATATLGDSTETSEPLQIKVSTGQ